MKKSIDTLLHEIVTFFEENQNPEIVKKYSRFFREGYDAYGIDKDLLPRQQKIWTGRYAETLGLEGFCDLGDRLVRVGKYEPVILAVLFLVPFRESFSLGTCSRVGAWLDEGITNWAQTDVLCQQILSPMLSDSVIDIPDLIPWREAASRWKRRGVPVTLLALKSQTDQYPSMFDGISPLMTDPERVVHQGVGWLLREMWKVDPSQVEPFLRSWKETAPRLIFQYATEKMYPEKRLEFRRSRKGKNERGLFFTRDPAPDT